MSIMAHTNTMAVVSSWLLNAAWVYYPTSLFLHKDMERDAVEFRDTGVKDLMLHFRRFFLW